MTVFEEIYVFPRNCVPRNCASTAKVRRARLGVATERGRPTGAHLNVTERPARSTLGPDEDLECRSFACGSPTPSTCCTRAPTSPSRHALHQSDGSSSAGAIEGGDDSEMVSGTLDSHTRGRGRAKRKNPGKAGNYRERRRSRQEIRGLAPSPARVQLLCNQATTSFVIQARLDLPLRLSTTPSGASYESPFAPPAYRTGLARERRTLPPPGGYDSSHDVGVRHRQTVRLRQSPVAGVHWAHD